jgi:hypothetical protein
MPLCIWRRVAVLLRTSLTPRTIPERESGYGETKMVYDLISLYSYEKMAITTAARKARGCRQMEILCPLKPTILYLFRRQDKESLKISQVIFNTGAPEDYP